MCERCFQTASESGFPKVVLDRYRRRKSRFFMERRLAGDIAHFRFFHQKGGAKEEFWKGIEFCTFHDDGRTEYRICYWANRGRGKGWRWGQYATFFPQELWKAVSDYIGAHPDGEP